MTIFKSIPYVNHNGVFDMEVKKPEHPFLFGDMLKAPLESTYYYYYYYYYYYFY